MRKRCNRYQRFIEHFNAVLGVTNNTETKILTSSDTVAVIFIGFPLPLLDDAFIQPKNNADGSHVTPRAIQSVAGRWLKKRIFYFLFSNQRQQTAAMK
jgi:hypothetical protein